MPPKKANKAAPQYDGPMEGEGNFFYGNGATYSGSWKIVLPADDAPQPEDGSPLRPRRVRDGHGTYRDGDCYYEGNFQDDDMCGKGTFKYASGASYSGDWKGNKYHGHGTYTWPDGRRYIGEFVENVMHGNGMYCDNEGRTWSGKFFQGSGPGLTFDL